MNRDLIFANESFSDQEALHTLLRLARARPLARGGRAAPENCVSGTMAGVVLHMERFKVNLLNDLFFSLADPSLPWVEICQVLPAPETTCLP